MKKPTRKPKTGRAYSALLIKLGIAYERANVDRDYQRLIELENRIEQVCQWQWDFGIWPAPRLVQGRNQVSKLRKTGVVYNV